MTVEHIGVADAKRRFSELADRVGKGESFIVMSRGRPVLALVPPQRAEDDVPAPCGLAAVAGVLAGDWDTIDEDMAAIVAARGEVVDRPAPDLG